MQTRIAILVVPDSRKEAAFSSRGRPCPSCPPDWIFLEWDDGTDLRLTGDRLTAAARRAEALGATHLALVPGWTPSLKKNLLRLAEAGTAYPDALILGRRPAIPGDLLRHRWTERIRPRFWLKVQTGRHLEDPATPLRIYPLAVIHHVKPNQSGACLAAEALVKSAWAGVPFREIAVDADDAGCGNTGVSWGEAIWRLLLNVHFTLRSVLPIPHRKLVTEGSGGGRAISVWRPMASLRTLLRENASTTQVALASAIGVFLGTLPLIACHSLIIMLAANYFRLNKVVALSASQLCMPPVVPALCIETGYWLRHGRFLTEISLETIGYQALERLYEWLLGALVLAPLLACLMGAVTLVLAQLAARSLTTIRNLKPTPENGAESRGL